MKYDGHHLHIEYLLGKTMKEQALAIEAHKNDAIYYHYKNIILNICVFVKEDSMILKKYIHFHLNVS